MERRYKKILIIQMLKPFNIKLEIYSQKIHGTLFITSSTPEPRLFAVVSKGNIQNWLIRTWNDGPLNELDLNEIYT